MIFAWKKINESNFLIVIAFAELICAIERVFPWLKDPYKDPLKGGHYETL
jgi:hypothetical protein